MTANVGTIDRLARLILGVLLIAAPFLTNIALFQSTPMTWVAVIVGLVLIGTSAMKFCPIYRIFGLRTCRV
jgi:hypothetical protein